MSEKILNLTDATFPDAIASGVTLVDFWAPWCGPCQMMGPILESLVGKVDGKATIAKVNVDENGKAAASFGIQSIPTLVLFKDGQEVDRLNGLKSEEVLLQAIEAALA